MSSRKSRPVLIMNSIMAGAQVFVGGAAFAEVVPVQVAGIMVLGLAAVQVGWARYLEESTVPFEDAGAYLDKNGNMVAGPASPSTVAAGELVTSIEGSGPAPSTDG